MKIKEDNFLGLLKKGNERALEYVIEQYGGLVKSIIKKHLYRLPEYQDDCMNDVFLGIWNNIHHFDERKSTFKNWIAGISKYKAIDFSRKHLKHMQDECIDLLEIASEDTSFRELVKQELDRDLDELLKNLKEEDRLLFLKLYVEEQEMDSICRDTGLKRNVIYNRLSRGRQKLRKMRQA